MLRYVYLGMLAVVVVGLAAASFHGRQAPQVPEALFGGVSLRIEYATTTAARELGLSGRTTVPEDYGMLFVFPKSERYGFWMKDMLVPLDIFWLDDKGQVVYLAESVAPETYPSVLYPSEPALYVLETAAGFARTHRIGIGTPLLLKNFEHVSE